MENTIEKQIELLRLCNEKGLVCNFTLDCGQIYVMLLNHETNEWKFYEYISINENAIENLNELIEKVKNYK